MHSGSCPQLFARHVSRHRAISVAPHGEHVSAASQCFLCAALSPPNQIGDQMYCFAPFLMHLSANLTLCHLHGITSLLFCAIRSQHCLCCIAASTRHSAVPVASQHQPHAELRLPINTIYLLLLLKRWRRRDHLSLCVSIIVEMFAGTTFCAQ